MSSTNASKVCPAPVWLCKVLRCFLCRISYFASSEALDIAGFGPSTVSVLLEHGLIEDAPDLFELHNKQEALLKLPRFEQKRVQSVYCCHCAIVGVEADDGSCSCCDQSSGVATSAVLCRCW